MSTVRALPALLLVLCICSSIAHGARYGTLPPSTAASGPTLRISDHAPLCAEQSNCIETNGATRAYSIADGDHVTIDWTNQAQPMSGVLELRHLYLPFDATANPSSPTPITITMRIPTDGNGPQVVVDYAGTSHRVRLQPNAWQPITIYNPNERVIYVRLDTPATVSPAN